MQFLHPKRVCVSTAYMFEYKLNLACTVPHRWTAHGASEEVGRPGTAGSMSVGADDGIPADELDHKGPEMPASWVPKLTIARDAFDMRCPRGSKLVLYHRAQVWRRVGRGLGTVEM